MEYAYQQYLTKANRTIGFLRRTLFSCTQDVKEAAYKGMVCPILEYGSSVWDTYTDKLHEEWEKVQNCAARIVTRNYVYETGSMTGIIGQLKWESLKKRRKDKRLILLYKGHRVQSLPRKRGRNTGTVVVSRRIAVDSPPFWWKII